MMICVGVLFLTGCNATDENVNTQQISVDSGASDDSGQNEYSKNLKAWWTYFNDPILDRIVSASLQLNAQNKIGNSGNIYVNPNAESVSDIVKTYMQYRSLQNHNRSLSGFVDSLSDVDLRKNKKNEKIRKIVEDDLNGSQSAKNKITSEMEVIERDLANRTGLLPEYVVQILKDIKPLPAGDIKPVLLTPVKALAFVPDVKKHGDVKYADPVTLFPDMIIGDFFGVSQQAYASDNKPWSLNAGTFSNHMDRAKFNKSNENEMHIIKPLMSIGSELSNFQIKLILYADLGIQHTTLQNAYQEKLKSPNLSIGRNRNNIDYISKYTKAQKELYDAEVATLKAQYERVKTLVDIYAYFNAYN